MKRILITVVLAIGMVVTIQAQNGLNKNAKAIKKHGPKRFELIQDFAKQDLKTDNAMLVSVINTQCDALVEFLLASRNPKYDDALFKRVTENWTKIIEGYAIRNYQMIMEEYRGQLEANTQ